MEQHFVYIISNPSHSVLYTGATSDLEKRIWEHKNKVVEGFTKKYNCRKLLYYEIGESFEGVRNRERQIKRYKREWKENLIMAFNPHWKDLSDDFLELRMLNFPDAKVSGL